VVRRLFDPIALPDGRKRSRCAASSNAFYLLWDGERNSVRDGEMSDLREKANTSEFYEDDKAERIA
jgi:hypothetical protein